MLSAENLLAKLGALDEETLQLLNAAIEAGDIRTALAAIRESRSNIEAYARIDLPLPDVPAQRPLSEHEARRMYKDQLMSRWIGTVDADTDLDDPGATQ